MKKPTRRANLSPRDKADFRIGCYMILVLAFCSWGIFAFVMQLAKWLLAWYTIYLEFFLQN